MWQQAFSSAALSNSAVGTVNVLNAVYSGASWNVIFNLNIESNKTIKWKS